MALNIPNMKNKILLVYPGGFGSIYPELPLSLVYIAWALKKKNYVIEILDARLKDYRDITSVDDYLFVGFSTMTGPMIKEALNVAEHVRNLNNNIPLVWGGVHVSLLVEQSLQNEFVDIIVRGEGELTVQELADAIANNRPLEGIQGISFKLDGKPVHNPDRAFMDMDDIDKELPYELFEMDKYFRKDIPMPFPLHTSRGCPFKCGFCYNVVFNKRKWRERSAERVLDEMEYLIKRFNVTEFSLVWEDEFFINVKRVAAICKGIIDRGIKIKWSAFCHFATFAKVSDELLVLLEKSGLELLSFGGESGSQRILDTIVQKGITVEQVLAGTERMSKVNITQVISYMSCMPTETYEDLLETFAVIEKLIKLNPRLVVNGIFLYTPYPGTPMFNIVTKDFNYETPQTLEAWSEFQIYRDVGVTWQNPSFVKICKTLSILTRFPFYKENFSFKDVSESIGSSRFNKFPLNFVYYFFTLSAVLRFKYRLFKFPIEWIFLEWILLKKRGFI